MPKYRNRCSKFRIEWNLFFRQDVRSRQNFQYKINEEKEGIESKKFQLLDEGNKDNQREEIDKYLKSYLLDEDNEKEGINEIHLLDEGNESREGEEKDKYH